MTRWTPRATIVLTLLCLGFAPVLALAQSAPGGSSRLPPYLDEVRRVSAAWERRTGPGRQVVDMVCLVPDVPTFLEAIASWDETSWFPILIDDVEFSFKFLRAFRPARIVRLPRRAAAIPDDQLWPRAVEAVRQAGAMDGKDTPRSPNSAPGVVLSGPSSPMLAGAVALAAGRSQPLLRWETPRRFADVLSADEARDHIAAIENVLNAAGVGHNRLGDDCDFITLAGDYPYRYNARDEPGSPFDVQGAFRKKAAGPLAFDDLVGRSPSGPTRWAFSGRLLGDAQLSVYRAMCSLFLQPRSALLLNTYDEKDPAWASYAMALATRRLDSLVPATHRSGGRASLSGWHQAFDPLNACGLLLINTHGEPTRFHVTDGTAITGDIPETDPTVVLMTHSFSAADPLDAGTIAGRWLANGAYVYFGSMNEPALQSFRTPDVVAALLVEGVPLGAATRQSPPEPFGRPWRLVYLGDPLFRLKPLGETARMSPSRWPSAASWPRYANQPRPAAESSDRDRLHWVVKAAVARLQRDAQGPTLPELARDLLAIRRSNLDPSLRPFHDALLADTLLQTKQVATLHAQLVQIPSAERSASLRRLLETSRIQLLQRAVVSHDFKKAQALWSELVRSGASPEVLEQLTSRVGTLADSPTRRAQWRDILTAAHRLLKNDQAANVLENERKRVEAQR